MPTLCLCQENLAENMAEVTMYVAMSQCFLELHILFFHFSLQVVVPMKSGVMFSARIV